MMDENSSVTITHSLLLVMSSIQIQYPESIYFFLFKRLSLQTLVRGEVSHHDDTNDGDRGME